MIRIAFVCHDGLSTLIFARWYAAQFQGRPDIRFYTISSRDLYASELDALGSEGHRLELERSEVLGRKQALAARVEEV